jgi:hypothetical protein
MATDGQRAGLRLDYDQTTDLLRTLTDVRFKLLAFVPTISGAAVGLLSGRSAAELLAVGTLGLLATLGIVVYELRNTQIYDYALQRAKELEVRLGIASVFHAHATAGLYGERPGRSVRVFGVLVVAQDRGLALVYSVAIGGWSYLVAWGALRLAGLAHAQAQASGGVIGAIAGLLGLIEFLRSSGSPTPTAPAPTTASGSRNP